MSNRSAALDSTTLRPLRTNERGITESLRAEREILAPNRRTFRKTWLRSMVRVDVHGLPIPSKPGSRLGEVDIHRPQDRVGGTSVRLEVRVAANLQDEVAE